MKKGSIVLVVILAIMFSLNVRAQGDSLQYNLDINGLEEIKNDKEKITKSVNELLESQLEVPVSVEELVFEDAVKVYTDTDLFSNEKVTNQMMQKYVSTANYVWLIPVYREQSTIMVTVSKGAAVSSEARAILDEADIAMLEENVGKWIVPEATVEEGKVNYKEALKQSLIKENVTSGTIYFMGGTKGFGQLIGVVCQDSDSCKIVLMSDVLKMLQNSGTEDMGVDVFSFENLKQNVPSSLDGEEMGGINGISGSDNQGKETNFIFIMGIAIIASVVCYGLKRRKSDSKL